MERDGIKEVSIDAAGRLCVMPSTARFPYIYREAMEVHWGEQGGFLFAPPKPRAEAASYSWWFHRIVAAAKEQGCELVLEEGTKWSNIPESLRMEFRSDGGRGYA